MGHSAGVAQCAERLLDPGSSRSQQSVRLEVPDPLAQHVWDCGQSSGPSHSMSVAIDPQPVALETHLKSPIAPQRKQASSTQVDVPHRTSGIGAGGGSVVASRASTPESRPATPPDPASTGLPALPASPPALPAAPVAPAVDESDTEASDVTCPASAPLEFPQATRRGAPDAINNSPE